VVLPARQILQLDALDIEFCRARSRIFFGTSSSGRGCALNPKRSPEITARLFQKRPIELLRNLTSYCLEA